MLFLKALNHFVALSCGQLPPPLPSIEFAGARRIGDPRLDPVNFAMSYERSNLGVVLARVANAQVAGCFAKHLGEFSGHTFRGKYPLYGNTHLTGMIKRALGQRRDDVSEIGVVTQNDR